MTPISFPSTPSAQLPAGRKLRVALFSGNYDCVRDGANRALNRLVAHLLERGRADVRIYSPRTPRPAFASVGEVHAVRSLSLPGRSEYRLALGFTAAARADFDAFKPDIVHLSAPDLLGRQAQHYARARGIAVIASLHTRFETYADYYRASFLRPMLERYLDRFYGDCDHILAPTPAIAGDLSACHGSHRVSIWSRGVDPAAFNPSLRSEAFRASHGYAATNIVPLFFGRLVKEKGLAVFADAIGLLRAKGAGIRPLIVGDGPARGWLAHRIPDAVFAGHLDGTHLGTAVASADILLNPSITEAFGNVNLEAMASGLAIVAADVPSAAALIADGRSGLLVRAMDPGAYAEAAKALVDDVPRLRSLGRMAAQAATGYRWDDALNAVYDAYLHCIGGAALRCAA